MVCWFSSYRSGQHFVGRCFWVNQKLIYKKCYIFVFSLMEYPMIHTVQVCTFSIS